MFGRKFYSNLLSVIVFTILLCAAAAAQQDTLSYAGGANSEKLEVKPLVTEKTDKIGKPEIKPVDSTHFYSVLDKVIGNRGLKRENVCNSKDLTESRILNDYGSVFVAVETVLPPPVCIFASFQEVEKFQKQIGIVRADLGGTLIELQPAAMESLLKARYEAVAAGFDITPRDGAEAGRRNFWDSVRLWNSRFFPACDYWLKAGRLTEEQVAKLKSLPVKQQVKEVLSLEDQGIYFNTAFNNSILYSVAAPGTSQHLSMLAFDANEYGNEKVRDILAKYGWHRTIKNDAPHFTYLGYTEENLEKIGLKKVLTKNGKFWIPNI